MTDRPTRFPPDLAALLSLYWIVLPIVALASWIFPAFSRARNEGDLTILWVGIGLGAAGSVLLFWAKLPHYRERRFLTFGPRHLDFRHRRIYRVAWSLIILSVFALGLLLALLW